MKKPIIVFRDFSFQYRTQSEPTLHHIDLTIYEGEKVLIVGPSGSGKSTLTHCINGLAPFFYPGEYTGSLTIYGKEQKELGIYLLSEMVGTVLQDPDGQFIGLTVAEDIAFKLENDAVPLAEMKERVRAAAETVGMEGFLDSAPHPLSGGQKQKVTLAGVLVNDVDVLLFDEPLANLDPHTGESAIELIDRLHTETGKTVILIEHRLEDALHRQVDRIIVVDEGRIAADATPNELLSTSILRDTGIREPLYLNALKYAGCRLQPKMNPQHVETIDLSDCLPALQQWYAQSKPSKPLPAAQPLLTFEHVDFAYEPGKPVLRDVSFTVCEGDMLSIVGRNGAGKSTISKLICGFCRPTGGRILFKGEDMASDTIKERASRIGYVMQNPNQMISKTFVMEEVGLGLKVRGVPETEIAERVHEALKICGLHEYRNWPISALSFGQKKRVTIASILVLNPSIVIVDEPTAGQDYRHYNEIMEFLLGLNRQGVTILMITHDMHLMLEYTNRTIVLSEGRKLADDVPSHVLTDERLIQAANLKGTSIYKLAVRAGFDEPREFVRRFIDVDRKERLS